MSKRTRAIALACIASLLAFALTACANANTPSSDAPQGSAASKASGEPGVTREDVEAELNKAAGAAFENLSFSTKTETTVTGAATNGQANSQTVTTVTKGQLDKSGAKPRLHMSYKAQSSTDVNTTEYEMFIDQSNLIVQQGDQIYMDAMSDAVLQSYADSITSVASPDEIGAILDMAASFKVSEGDGVKTVTVTVDKDELAKSDLVDASSLPDNTEIATMVVSYDIGEDDRFKTIRVMSSTSGSPTYRVNQTYAYSDYDATEMPAWPDVNAYAAKSSGIMTDANGNMYIVGDDGQLYYVTSINDDGTVSYNMGTATESTIVTYYETESEPTGFYATIADAESAFYSTLADADASESGTVTETIVPTEGGSTSTDASGDTAGGEGGTSSDDSSDDGSSENVGRAYITADDGTVHFLDEEGSRLFDNGDGTRYFIDADGNFYFLAE